MCFGVLSPMNDSWESLSAAQASWTAASMKLQKTLGVTDDAVSVEVKVRRSFEGGRRVSRAVCRTSVYRLVWSSVFFFFSFVV